ncbi:bifunctional glutamate N-acetyltransferase/amino-acid acetyltransferase ArgJ [bacterium]|nr:bifunctional glutamate N-acetyltransferase/amino-acid acetyltransferase ArgJ [bacterium]
MEEKRYDLPNGFLCSGISAGIKEEKGKKDLGLIYTKDEAILGAVYTQNRFPSAHVQYCRSLTPSDRFRALIINSGNANAATGTRGLEANLEMALSLAGQLRVEPNQVFTSSTGIIGHQLPIDKIASSIPCLVEGLTPDCQSVAEAIMTTDTKLKLARENMSVKGKEYTVIGFAKGSGMIHPNMATMLAYVLTDAPLPYSAIQAVTEEISKKSFNCVSVDGDTSTNDSFYLISSNPVSEIDENSLDIIKSGFSKVAISLAKQIAGDGEGAKHLVEVRIAESPSKEIARNLMNAILTSNLVKTAIHGNDPNWGRILMAAGNGLPKNWNDINPPVSIKIQSVPVFINGEPASFDAKKLSEKMSQFEVLIEFFLHSGHYSLTGWGCDFSKEYVSINAHYST